jgi:hypothetical protein
MFRRNSCRKIIVANGPNDWRRFDNAEIAVCITDAEPSLIV